MTVAGLRLGLCCAFVEAPIKFRTTTARYTGSLSPPARREKLRSIAWDNATALGSAVEWCAAHHVGAFRIQSEMLPLSTHPELGYELSSIDERGEIEGQLRAAGETAATRDVRLSFHPDQFIVPGSHRAEVVDRSLLDLESLAKLAGVVGAAQLTLHGGGAHGGKEAALDRLVRGLARLSPRARKLIVLENDDRVFTVEDLLPICRREGIPLVYDVHHHRCNPDRLDVEEATDAATETWASREPWAHVSSPLHGWGSTNPRPHSDFIDPDDLPRSWLSRDLTVDVEAKAKELAVLRLRRWIDRRGLASASPAVEPPG